MDEAKLGDKCPACGVPRQSFEPYADPMSPSRRRILKLDLHSIAVHFPISFTTAIVVFLVGIFFFPEPVKGPLISTTSVMAWFLPALVLIAFLIGLLDGRARFRKISNSHILKVKILLAAILFVLSLALAILIWIGGFSDPLLTLVYIVIDAGALGCIVLLSLLGVSIMESALPGK
jgi:uncharacterized membrane protein